MLKMYLVLIILFRYSIGVYGNNDSIPKPFPRIDYDLDGAIQRLSKSITFETVSTAPGYVNETQISRFIDFLKTSFPKVHDTPWIERQIINKSLVYIVKSLVSEGRGSGDVTIPPVNQSDVIDQPWILQAHQDVVPVTDWDKWTFPPFGGKIVYRPDDGDQSKTGKKIEFRPNQEENSNYFVYGRGIMDVKHVVMASLEALEHMIGQGHRLATNSLVLSFGHDEETGGNYGAKAVARYLEARFQTVPDVKPFAFLLDEGFSILEDVLPDGYKIAPIGVGEKIVADVTMTVQTPPGHSSLPPKENAISILAGAINRFQAFDFPCMFAAPGTPDLELCRRIAPVYPENRRLLLLNADLFADQIPLLLDNNVYARAMFRTTKAVTLISGGVKSNIIPSWAQANINHRIHPLQTQAEILQTVTSVVNDSRVSIVLKTKRDPIPISDYNSPGFGLIEKTINQLFGVGIIVVPAILTAGTDSKHFTEIVRNVFRFTPLTLKTADVQRIHGINERISVAVYDDCVNFYYRLMETVSGFGY